MFRKLRQKHAIWLAMTAFLVFLFATQTVMAKKPTDTGISDRVEDELASDMMTDLNKIDVISSDGVVTLSGFADNLIEKERSEKIAETVKGVKAVVNKLKVKPSVRRSDAQIKNDINEALLSDAATESFEIGVNVNNGNVILNGKVDSYRERLIAEKKAKLVKGVKNLDNNIDVTYTKERPDPAIKADVKKSLKWDILVDHGLIDVTVKNGKVKLTGTVGSLAEKRKAKMDAWVAGAESIDVSDLKIKYWARNEDLKKGKYGKKSESEIKKAVQDALIYDPRVQISTVRILVDENAVTLRGTVDSLKAKRAAADDARNTVGVARVKNRLKVRPKDSLTDRQIERNIEKALDRNIYAERYEIDAEVENGIAYLEGAVDTFLEKAQADNVASEIKGVVDVENNLVVENVYDPYIYDPYLDDWYIYDYDWYQYQPGKTMASDSEIRDEINDEMWWSPFVDSDQVNVSVENGVATLTGKVDSWSEYYAANENALEGGATWVVNEMEIRR